MVYCAPFVFLEADRDHQSCENYCGVEMNLEELAKQVLVLDEKAKGPLRHYQRGTGIDREIEIRTENGGTLYRSTSYGNMALYGKAFAHFHTSAPLLAKACLRMKEALEKIKVVSGTSTEHWHLANQALADIDKIVAGEG